MRVQHEAIDQWPWAAEDAALDTFRNFPAGDCGDATVPRFVLCDERLRLRRKPIILVNTRRFYDRFQDLMDFCVAEKFLSPRHLKLWQVVDHPEEVLPAIRQTPPWHGDLQSAQMS
jgi:hypothetical protein